MKLQQTSLLQTGIAIINSENGEMMVPLFSDKPVMEAAEVAETCGGIIANVYITNNLKNRIRRGTEGSPLSRIVMEEIRSGFSNILGPKAVHPIQSSYV